MKLPHSAAAVLTAVLLQPLAAAATITTTTTGNVYILEPAAERSPARSEILSPTAARSVLAHRAGVEDFHSADLRVDGVLEAINAYGSHSPSLLRPVLGRLRRGRRGLVLFEGVDEREDVEGMFLPLPFPRMNRWSKDRGWDG